MSGRNALNPQQVRELCAQLLHGVPLNLDPYDYHYWKKHRHELNAIIEQALRRPRFQLVTTVTVPAIPSFDVGAHLVVTPDKDRQNAELVIGWMGGNAQRLVEGLVEPAVAEAKLRVHALMKPSLDGQIIAELGGEEIVATTCGQMWEMMRRQGRGQQGLLLTDGRANVFYRRDAEGVLWSVYCNWYAANGDWSVGARPVTFPYLWNADYQVVSR